MLDKFLAAISLAGLFVFVGVLIYKVNEIDLRIICIAVLVMAAVDFYLLNRGKKS